MTNATACGDGMLDPYFAAVPASPVRLTSAAPLVVQSLPVALTLLSWLLVEGRPTRAPYTRCAVRSACAGGVLAGVASTFLVWRVFDLQSCDDLVTWTVVACCASFGTTVLILFVLANVSVRLGIASALAVAAGAVVADWCLRGGAVLVAAAAPLVAVQQLWCLQAACLFVSLPGKTRTGRRVRTTPVLVVDSLATRKALSAAATTAPPAASRTSVWSWFV